MPPANPTPGVSSLSPAIASAGGAGFTLTVSGSGFVSLLAVYWGNTALTTQYMSATQLSAQVPTSSITASGISAITVQSPSPGGGTSNSFDFEVDTAGTTPPSFTTASATVTAGSSATYNVTLPSSATNVSVQCLNLPSGASCSYSASSSAVTIATSSTTPKGSYQTIIIFTETLPGAASAGIFFPFLLLPLLYFRERLKRGVWITTCIILVFACGISCAIGCGGGSSGSTGPPSNPTHVVSSSGVVTLTVQ
jgi:hypothetical protein